ncbi:MAG: M28 family peptidase [Acidobacteria bacterium]|nr:MAG: M28 family peptidase [Acidobacteriota bacterium]
MIDDRAGIDAAERPDAPGRGLELDLERVLSDARALAFPRYPGSDGDRRAIAMVAERLAEAGLAVTRESFSYDVAPIFRGLSTVLVALALVVAAAGWGLARAPGPVLLALGASFAAAALLLGWSPWLERLYRRPGPTTTENVAGRRDAAGAPRLTIVLLAHHDSKSQNLTMLARGALTVVALLGSAGLAALAAAALMRGAPPGPAWLGPAGGLITAAALLALSTLRSGNRSPGGVDNAGSLALILELGRRLPPQAPDDVEWIVLSTGAEEDHMVGAIRWLDAHREALRGRPVWVLNFDGAGAPGKVALLERFGFGRRFSPTLSRLARRCAERLGIPVRGVYLPPAMGIDAIPFAHRGVDCLTFTSGSLDRATLAVHSPRDVAENLDRATLERVARLAAAVALDLARGDGDPIGPSPSPVAADASRRDASRQPGNSRADGGRR